jgi:hypothetical protein
MKIGVNEEKQLKTSDMSHWKLFVPYKCKHCKGSFVILQGRGMFKSYLAINYDSWDGDVTQFDKDKGHISHLIKCEGLQKQFEDIKKDLEIHWKLQEKEQMKNLLK